MVDSKQQWKAWLYLLPAIILLLIFTVWPIINTLRMAFTVRWDPELPVEYEIIEEVVTIWDENGDQVEVVNKKEVPVRWGGYTTYKISESICSYAVADTLNKLSYYSFGFAVASSAVRGLAYLF